MTGSRAYTQVGEHSGGIELAARLDDPGDHQILEHRITDGMETQRVVHRAERLIQQPRTGRHGMAGSGQSMSDRPLLVFRWAPIGNLIQSGDPAGHLQIQDLLQPINQTARTLQQNTQLSIGMSGSHVLNDHDLAGFFAGHLHRHRTRGGAHLPDVRHDPESSRLVPQTTPPGHQISRSQQCRSENPQAMT